MFGADATAAADRARIVCSDGARALDLDTLLRQAAAIAAELPPPRPGSMVAFAFGTDRLAFAAALIGTWMAGHAAGLPENARRERVVPVLDHPDTMAFLQDTGVGRGLCVPRLLRGRALPTVADVPAPAAAAPAIAAFTAADVGEVQRLDWTHAELWTAVDRIAAMLPLRPARTVVTALTPTYVPALFAGLLAPLRHGGRFSAAPPEPEAIRRAAADPAATALLLPREHGFGGTRWPVPVVVAETIGAALGLAVEPRRMADRLGDRAAEPRDENGRLLHEELCLRLGLGRDGQPIERELSWQPAQAADGEHCFRTVVPPRYAFFEGHFTTYPVLAGAVQLHELVLPCIRRIAPALGAVQGLGNVKFLARIAPGDEVEVRLRPVPAGAAIDFEIRRGETRCTSGRVTFAPPAAEPA